MEPEPSEEEAAAEGSLEQGQDEPSVLGNSTDVKVVVRVRPQVLGVELQPDVATCVEVDGFNSLLVRSASEASSMQFNWVAGPATTQGEFFKVVGRPTVENCLSGFNSSVFAYGQTGSGKTHTMIGELPEESDVLPPNAGLIPRIFQYLWRRMQEVQSGMLANSANNTAAAGSGASSPSSSKDGGEAGDEASSSSSGSAAQPSLTWMVRCSMLEIHREEVYDLLRPNSGPLNLREDIRKGVYVEGLAERVVDNMQDALGVLRTGIALRQVAATQYNAASSRSHCIFTCHVESRLEPQPGLVNVRSSRLHLVDLAGSERLRYGLGGMALGEGGDRQLKETTAINTSLSVLGLVILRLTEQQPHIPYRNSKLTFLLQDSIGGNAKTIIVANVSPSEACLHETLSTLKFATRARNLVNKAVINEDTNGDAALLRLENRRLRQELALARGLIATGSEGGPGGQAAAAEQLEQQHAQLQSALDLLDELGKRNRDLQEALEFGKRERSELEHKCLEGRQELAAAQVSLQQTMREYRAYRHKWFRLDKSSSSKLNSTSTSTDVAAAAGSTTPIAGGTTPRTAAYSLQEQGTPGSITQFRMQHSAAMRPSIGGSDQVDAAAAAAASSEQESRVDELLGLLSSHLSELVSSVCPLAAAAQQPNAAAAAAAAAGSSELPAAGVTGVRPVAAGSRVRQSLQELTAVCQPRLHEVPELGNILSSLELLADWQHQHTMRASSQLSADAPVFEPASPACVAAAAASGASAQRDGLAAAAAVQGEVSGIPKASFVPSELHRQLEEERQLNAQLSEQVRLLQQQLVKAGAAVSKSCSSLSVRGKAADVCSSMDSVLRGSTVAYQAASYDSADAAAAAAQQLEQPLVRLHIQVNAHAGPAAAAAAAAIMSQQQPGDLSAEGSSSSVVAVMEDADLASAARLTALQQQVAALQEQLEVVTRDKTSLQGRLTHARSVLAAARCSTPSSLCSSRLPSPQPCFSPLRPLYGESIDEEPEDESPTGLAAPGSWRRRGASASSSSSSAAAAGSGSPSTPTKQIVPASSPGLPELVTSPDGHAANEEGLSHAEVWQQHYQPRQQHQQELQQREQLAREVRAAIVAATAAKGGTGGLHQLPPPLPTQQQQQCSSSASPTGKPPARPACNSAERAAAAAASPGSPHSVCSLEALLQQTPPRLQLPQHWGTDIRASGGGLGAFIRSYRLQIEQLLQESHAGQTPQPQQEADQAALQLQQHAEASAALAASSPAATAAAVSPACSVRSSRSTLPQGDAAPAEGNAPADFAAAAPAAEAEVSPAAAADGLGCEASGNFDQQQQQQQPGGPTWGVDDYEEEFRQLSEQLQELVSANSSLKAALQQRDLALEQRCHELGASESMLQELHERLAASEAAAAEAAAQHCDAMWAKGQVAGLLELNETLQLQLEAQGQELEGLKAALERFMATEATPEAAEAYAAASAALEQEASTDSPTSSSKDQHSSADAELPPEGPAVTLDAPAQQQQQQAEEQGAAFEEPAAEADSAEGTADSDGAAQQETPAAAAAAAAAAATAGADAAAAGQDQQTPARVPAAGSALIKATTPGTPAAGMAAAASTASTTRRQIQAARTPAVPAASALSSAKQVPSVSSSVAKKLRQQTSQLSAQPSNMAVAAEQAILLRYHIEAVGLQLEKKKCEARMQQCEAKLAQLSRQQGQLKQRHQAKQQHDEQQLLRHQRHRQQQEAKSSTPQKQLQLYRTSSSSSGEVGGVAGSARAATTGARMRPGLYSYSLRSPLEASPVGAFALRLAAGDAAAAAESVSKAAAAASSAVADAAVMALIASPAEASSQVQAGSRTASAAASPAGAEQEQAAASSATAAEGSSSSSKHTASTTAAGKDAEQSHSSCSVVAAACAEELAGRSSEGANASAAGSSSQPTATAAAKAACSASSCDDADAQSSCSSRCSDSSSSSLGACQDTLFELLHQLQALAQESHEASNFTAISASTLAGTTAAEGAAGAATAAAAPAAAAGPQGGWPSAVAAEVQTRLQVKSACHLEMTRGLMSASDVLMTLQEQLTAEKQQGTRPRQQQQQRAQGASSPIARSLLSSFEGAVPELGAAAAAAAAVVVETPPRVGEAAEPAAAAEQGAQQQWLQVLQRVEQQQQRILQVLGTTAADGAAAADISNENKGSSSSTSSKQEAASSASHLAELQNVQQDLLQQLQEAKAALLQGSAVRQQQQQHSWGSPGGRQQDRIGATGRCQEELGFPCSSSTQLPPGQADENEAGLRTPRAAAAAASTADDLDAAAASANAAAAGRSGGGSRSPTRRSQQRAKQRELRQSLDGPLLQQQQHGGAAGGSSSVSADRSDQQQLRDSHKEGRLQQLLRGAKAAGSLLHDAAAVAVSCDDVSCQTEDLEVLPAAAAAAAGCGSADAPGASPGVQLRVCLPGEEAASTCSTAAAAEAGDSAELLQQLRGKVAKLEMQLDEQRLKTETAMKLRDRAWQEQPRSHSSCSSRGGELEPHHAALLLAGSRVGGLRASSEQQLQLGCASAGDGASAAHAQRAPLLPPGLFSPRREQLVAAAALHGAGAGSGLSRSFSGTGSLASPGAGSGSSCGAAAAVPQNMSLVLTGEVRKLQSENFTYMCQISELRDTVRRQELQLRQQALPAAAFSSSGGGARTPRAGGGSSSGGGSGLFSPRVAGGGSGLFSPRLLGTPGRASAAAAAAGEVVFGSSSGSSQVAGDAGVPLYDGGLGAAGSSPTKALKSPLGVKGSSMSIGGMGQQGSGLGLNSAGWGSHHGLDAVPEDSAVLRKDSRRFSTGGVPAAQQQQQQQGGGNSSGSGSGSSSGSSRRLSLGAAGPGGASGKGVRLVVAPAGRLRVAAIAKAQQQRRQSMG